MCHNHSRINVKVVKYQNKYAKKALMKCYWPNVSVLTCSCNKLASHIKLHVIQCCSAHHVPVQHKAEVWLLQQQYV